MRSFPLLIAAALTVLACSDFRSINPIADPDEKLEEPGIVGDWVMIPEQGVDDDGVLFRVRAIADRPGEYRLTELDSLSNVFRILVRPTRIGGRLVLDLCTDTTTALSTDALPVHTAYFVLRLAPDTIVVTGLQQLGSLLDGGEQVAGIAHIGLPESGPFGPGSSPVVTASTAEIRRFLAQAQALPEALDSTEALKFRRLR